MTDPSRPDPWRVVNDLVAEVEERRRIDPELAERLDSERARFGSGGDDVASLLDEVARRAIVDVEAPVESSRPVVPQIKLAIRKANAFVSRHLAQQVTVITQVLVEAVRRLDQRVGALEAGEDIEDLLAMVPDHVSLFEVELGRLHADVDGIRRDVRTPAEVDSLPSEDAGLVVLGGLVDVLSSAARARTLRIALAAVSAGGAVAVVGTRPAAWVEAAGQVLADLAPGHPVHATSLAHVLTQAGAIATEVHERGPALMVVARR